MNRFSSNVRRTSSLAAAFAVLLTATASTFAGEAVNTDKTGVAIGGYDPVAYFTDSKPVKGNFQIASTHEGATYWFASKEHKDLFDANPAKYTPQFGGYCAFGVSIAKKLNGDPAVWKIVDGKLYLNVNPAIAEKFAENPEGIVKTAAEKWPEIKDKTAAEANK